MFHVEQRTQKFDETRYARRRDIYPAVCDMPIRDVTVGGDVPAARI